MNTPPTRPIVRLPRAETFTRCATLPLCLCAHLLLPGAGWSQALSEPVWEWAAHAGGGSPGSGYGVVVDAEGNTCIAGTFVNMVVFGTNVLNCPAGRDGFFVAKYDSLGRPLWAKCAADHRADYAVPAGLGVSADGAVYVAGVARWGSYLYLAKLTPVPLSFTPVAYCASNGAFRLQVQGLRGRGPVVIEASTDLLNWAPICTNATPTEPLDIEEPMTPPVRFYRAVVP